MKARRGQFVTRGVFAGIVAIAAILAGSHSIRAQVGFAVADEGVQLEQEIIVSDDEHALVPHSEAIHEEPTFIWGMIEAIPETIEVIKPLRTPFEWLLEEEEHHVESRLSDVPIGLQAVPDRPPLLLETNELFLGPGYLSQGIEVGTGAVWRPSLWVFGTYRTGIQYFDNRAATNVTEWVQRLDLFGQLNLTGTERLLVGIRPFDEEHLARREYTSYDFTDGQWLDGWNAQIETLFFEGDFGEIFPNLDPYDSKWLDYGFTVGRQPLFIQEGLLINENRLDAVTVTRNTIYGGGILNLRVTGMYAWNQVNRDGFAPVGNRLDDTAQLFGIFTETDLAATTIRADGVYLDSDERGKASLFAGGISAIQRINGFHNTYNTALHVLGSFPNQGETPFAGQGELIFGRVSWVPHKTDDLIYLNGFWAIDQFTSPAREPEAGGPLGQVGILYAAPALGRFGAPLNNQASDAVGGSIGYQMFFDEARKQVILELGGRTDTRGKDARGANDPAIAGGARYQQAIGQHWIFILDGFAAKQESCGVSPGARVEFLSKF